VRLVGVVDSARGLAAASHVGWGYPDRAELWTRAREYLADGVEAGQRIEFVGSGGVEGLRAALAGAARGGPPDDRGPVLEHDAVRVVSVDQVYAFSGAGRVVDPVRSVAARVAATAEAVRAGYTGLRAVVDATALAGTAEQRAAYAHYEYLLDRQSSVLPLATICAYDLTRLGGAAVAELACLHPLTSRGASAFRLYADGDAAFALAGEIDSSSTGQLADTLGRVLPLVAGPELVVDAHELEFIDHRALLVLDRCVAQRGARLVLRTPRKTVAHVVEAIGLRHLRVEVRR
jgi:anti-anti-sigma regulatory factor